MIISVGVRVREVIKMMVEKWIERITGEQIGRQHEWIIIMADSETTDEIYHAISHAHNFLHLLIKDLNTQSS